MSALGLAHIDLDLISDPKPSKTYCNVYKCFYGIIYLINITFAALLVHKNAQNIVVIYYQPPTTKPLIKGVETIYRMVTVS